MANQRRNNSLCLFTFNFKNHCEVLKSVLTSLKFDLGRISQSEMEKQFLSSFSDVCSGSEVTFIEFEEYYEGLSIAMENDDDFINMLRNCWGI